MNLFINAVSTEWKLILFDNDRNILFSKDILVLWNESSKLTSILDEFLSENNIEYNYLNNIVVVSGPGSFTWIRAISLMVNTIAFTCNTKLTDISFFDLFSFYPIIKSSSKRDSFVKKDKNAIIEVMSNENIVDYFEQNKINRVYGDLTLNYLPDNIKLDNSINYENIIKNIQFTGKKIISPLYIKKPNIS